MQYARAHSSCPAHIAVRRARTRSNEGSNERRFYEESRVFLGN